MLVAVLVGDSILREANAVRPAVVMSSDQVFSRSRLLVLLVRSNWSMFRRFEASRLLIYTYFSKNGDSRRSTIVKIFLAWQYFSNFGT